MPTATYKRGETNACPESLTPLKDSGRHLEGHIYRGEIRGRVGMRSGERSSAVGLAPPFASERRGSR
ncbi:hypothetical protein MRX96_002438 [Rhipicephalus microplus]